MFDRAIIHIKSGNGGNGIVSFRREKFIPFGGPDGGDGGKGGDVIIKATRNEASLKKYYYNKEFTAENGGHGQKRKKHGKTGNTLTLEVPPGTVVTDITRENDHYLLADLNREGEELTAARGGKGGIGNVHFASSTNQTPKLASTGSPGEEKYMLLELKLLADVGIIGLPNAGKSSLLSMCSRAKPKIASYPFTTLEPVLGMVEKEQTLFAMADIPGLISGAAGGKGLGFEFLRHIIRTRLLVHLVDGSSQSPLESFNTVNRELALYDQSLTHKKQILAINKIDIPEVKSNIGKIVRDFGVEGHEPKFISALTGEGVEGLMDTIARNLIEQSEEKPEEPLSGEKVFKPKPKETGLKAIKTEAGYEIIDTHLKRIADGSLADDPEARRQLWNLIQKRGGLKELKKQNIKQGDIIKLGNFEWRW